MIEELLQAWREWSLYFLELPKLLASTVLVLAVVLVSKLIQTVIRRSVSDTLLGQRYWDLGRTLFIILGAVLLMGLWLEEVKTVGLLLTGLLAAMLISLKEMFLGFVGRLFITVVEPYEIGDLIEVNGVAGRVMMIGLLYTRVQEYDGELGNGQATGRAVLIPHLWLTQHALRNASHDHEVTWDDLRLNFPLWIDHERVQRVIEDAATQSQREWLPEAVRRLNQAGARYPGKIPAVQPVVRFVVRQFMAGEQILGAELRFAAPVRHLPEVRSCITAAVLTALKQAGLPLASMSSPPQVPLTVSAGGAPDQATPGTETPPRPAGD